MRSRSLTSREVFLSACRRAEKNCWRGVLRGRRGRGGDQREDGGGRRRAAPHGSSRSSCADLRFAPTFTRGGLDRAALHADGVAALAQVDLQRRRAARLDRVGALLEPALLAAELVGLEASRSAPCRSGWTRSCTIGPAPNVFGEIEIALVVDRRGDVDRRRRARLVRVVAPAAAAARREPLRAPRR